MDRKKTALRYGLGALTIAAFALVLLLAFGRGAAAAGNTTAGSTAGAAALEQQNAQLRATVEQMQQREAEYRRQIEAANATIEQLSAGSAGLQLQLPDGRELSVPGLFGFFPGDSGGRDSHERGEIEPWEG